MAKEIDPCSEMSKAIAEAISDIQTVDGVSAEEAINTFVETFPALDRNLVMDTLVAVGHQIVDDSDYLQTELSSMEQEAETPTQKKAVKKIRSEAETPSKKPVKAKPNEMKKLRKNIRSIEEALDPAHLSILAKKFERAIFERNQGMTRDQLLQAVYDELEGYVPEITLEKTRDALAGYGLIKEPGMDFITKTLREFNEELRLIAQLRDIAEGKAPRRTGPQRGEPSNEARRLRADVEEAKKTATYKVTDVRRELRSAQDRVKAALKNRINDLENALKPGGKKLSRRGAEIKEDDEIRSLKAERDRLQELYTTKFKEAPTDERRLANAIKAVERSARDWEKKLKGTYKRQQPRPLPASMVLETLQENRDALQLEYRLSKRAPSVVRGKKLLAELKKHLQEGTLPPKVDDEGKPKNLHHERIKKAIEDYRKLLNKSAPAVKERALKRIAKLEEKLATDFIPTVKARELPLTEELRSLAFEEHKLRLRANKRIADLSPKSPLHWLRLLNIDLQYLMAGAEFSMVGIQGGIYSFSHPSEAKKSFKKAWADSKTEQKTYAAYNEMMDTPWGAMAMRDRLATLPPDASMSRMEIEGMQLTGSMGEWLGENVIGKVPVGKQAREWYARTARMYTLFLNDIRMKWYRSLASMGTSNGIPTAEEGEQIAMLVNVATGRGGEGWQRFEQSVPFLNALLFAPRHVFSRFQLAGLSTRQSFRLARSGITKLDRGKQLPDWVRRETTDLDKKMNVMLATEAAKTGAAIAMFYSLLAMACKMWLEDDEWGIEPHLRSSDFWTFRIHNTRINPFFGLQQIFVLAARMVPAIDKDGFLYLSLQKKTLPKITESGRKYAEGKRVKIGQDREFNVKGIKETTTDFFMYKASPVVSGGLNLLEGTDFLGRPTHRAVLGAQLTTPMAYQDFVKSIEDLGLAKGSAAIVGTFVGLGVQTHDKR